MKDRKNETAAPVGAGSGGGSERAKGAEFLQDKKYLNSPPLATLFPILAVHVGLPLEGGAA